MREIAWGWDMPQGPTVSHSIDSREWVSVHLGAAGVIYDRAYDDLLRAEVFPRIRRARDEQLITLAFFVRYSQGGPHARLRLLPVDSRARAEILNLIEEPCGTGHSALYESVEYVPEVARYAGRHAIVVAERLFDVSTTLAMRELSLEVSMVRSLRLGRGLLAMLAAAFGIWQSLEGVHDFVRTYGGEYLTAFQREETNRESLLTAFDAGHAKQATELQEYVLEAWERLRDGESVTPSLDPFLESIKLLTEELRRLWANRLLRNHREVFESWDKAVRYLLPSYVHMTSNRLGITITEEAFLAYVLSKTLPQDA